MLNNCIDVANKYTKFYGGALQYMQGCGLMISFNAASRVAAHESKACDFALALRRELEGEIRLHVSIITGPITSFFAGTKGHLMLTLLGGFYPLHCAFQYYLHQMDLDGEYPSSNSSSIVMCPNTVSAVSAHFKSRCLGLVSHHNLTEESRLEKTTSQSSAQNVRNNSLSGTTASKSSGSKSSTSLQDSLRQLRKGANGSNIRNDLTVVHELQGRQDGVVDDEWMYHLSRQERKDQTLLLIEGAIDMAVSGNVSGALLLLQNSKDQLLQSSSEDAAVALSILKRLEQTSHLNQPFPLTALTIQMW